MGKLIVYNFSTDKNVKFFWKTMGEMLSNHWVVKNKEWSKLPVAGKTKG